MQLLQTSSAGLPTWRRFRGLSAVAREPLELGSISKNQNNPLKKLDQVDMIKKVYL